MSDKRNLGQQIINPASLRGRLVVAIHNVIREASEYPGVMSDIARQRGLDGPDQLLAVLLTQRVLDLLGKDGNEVLP